MADPKVHTIGEQAKRPVPEALFAEPFNESLVHETAVAEMNARRRGSHSTLTRGEVAMTGAKAWRQKGTGRARAGALSTPQRVGGGVAFGPRPERNYALKVNRKARRRALRCALSVHAARQSIAVADGERFDEPSTRTAARQLEDWGREGSLLVLVAEREVAVAKSFRNLERTTVLPGHAAGVADVVGARNLVLTREALERLVARAAAPADRRAAA